MEGNAFSVVPMNSSVPRQHCHDASIHTSTVLHLHPDQAADLAALATLAYQFKSDENEYLSKKKSRSANPASPANASSIVRTHKGPVAWCRRFLSKALHLNSLQA
jgi:hypothetical protein